MVKLIVVDAGHTLGIFDPPGTQDVLATLSPLPSRVIAEEGRRFLHCAPTLTEQVIADICNALLIDPDRWPRPWPERGFTAYPYVLEALAELAAIAPVVVLSNVPVTSGEKLMTDLLEQCAPYVRRAYTSFRMAMRKPDRRLWHSIAIEHQVPVEDVVHLGDQWTNDVLGALSAGCRAVYVNTRASAPPPVEQWPDQHHGRIAVAEDLRGAVPLVRDWHAEVAA